MLALVVVSVLIGAFAQRITGMGFALVVSPALVIILGLALFAYFGDPASGKENAPGGEWAIAILVIAVLCGIALSMGSRGGLSLKAAGYGAASRRAARVGMVEATGIEPVTSCLQSTCSTN